MGVFPKKSLQFLRGALDARSLEVSSGRIPIAPLQPAIDKVEGGLLVLFLGLSFSIGSLGNFSADALALVGLILMSL